MDCKSFEARHGYETKEEGRYTQRYDGTVYFAKLREEVHIIKRVWRSPLEVRDTEREHLGGVNVKTDADVFAVKLFADLPQFTALIMPHIERLNHDFSYLLAQGGYDSQKVFSFTFEAHYLPQ